MDKGPKMATTKSSEVFRQYLDKSKTLEQSLYQLERVIEAQGTSNVKSTTTAIKHDTRGQFTTLQLLTHVEDYMSSAAKIIKIDCISLVRKSNLFLRKLMSRLNRDLNTEYAPYPNFLEDSNELAYISRGQEILQEAQAFQDAQDERVLGKTELNSTRQSVHRLSRFSFARSTSYSTISGYIWYNCVPRSIFTAYHTLVESSVRLGDY